MIFPSQDGFWFPTPETCKNLEQLNGIHKRIFDKLFQLKIKGNLSQQKIPNFNANFFTKFICDESILSQLGKTELEKLSIEIHDILSRHRLDIGGNKVFEIKLTPQHDKPMYTRGPSTAIDLREDLLVELSLMQYFGIVTNLPFSNYSSPLFAKRKQSGALRFLIDNRRVNHLIRHYYDSHNFPISTLADASAHLAEKKLFAKLDCSHAYFALRMADPLSVQLLSFNFFSRFLLSPFWLNAWVDLLVCLVHLCESIWKINVSNT